MRYFQIFMALCLAMALGAGCGKQVQEETSGTESGTETDTAAPAAKTGEGMTIAVIPKGTTHIFWKSIHAGAVKASQETGCEIIWQGPQKEDDREIQIQVVENFITRGVDAIVLAPLDNKALVAPVEAAVEAGIKVIIIDSSLETDAYTSFVATDNKAGGMLAGARLAELLNEGQTALMMRYQVGSASTDNREEGFLEGIENAAAGIDLVSTNIYGGATREEAMQKAENLLTKYPEVDGIFCPNESTTFGMLRALREAGRAGDATFVGFDATDELVAALKDGQIHGLTVQNPFRMGYLGVKTAVDALNGETVEKRVDTGVTMVTPDNVDQPEIQELLSPDIEKWLGE